MAGYPDLPTRVKYAACAELKKIAVRHTVKSGMKNPLEGDGTLSPGTVKIPAALVAWRQSGVQRRVYA